MSYAGFNDEKLSTPVTRLVIEEEQTTKPLFDFLSLANSEDRNLPTTYTSAMRHLSVPLLSDEDRLEESGDSSPSIDRRVPKTTLAAHGNYQAFSIETKTSPTSEKSLWKSNSILGKKPKKKGSVRGIWRTSSDSEAVPQAQRRSIGSRAEMRCNLPECNNPAGRFRCPICYKNQLPKVTAVFCCQEHFEKHWPVHKKLHDTSAINKLALSQPSDDDYHSAQ